MSQRDKQGCFTLFLFIGTVGNLLVDQPTIALIVGIGTVLALIKYFQMDK